MSWLLFPYKLSTLFRFVLYAATQANFKHLSLRVTVKYSTETGDLIKPAGLLTFPVKLELLIVNIINSVLVLILNSHSLKALMMSDPKLHL